MNKKHIILTVINDLNYDQRMIRICTSLANAGYKVTLVGRSHRKSPALKQQPFLQHRLPVSYTQGKLMYFLYWVKLFFYLLFQKADAFCAIDLDTILPVYFASKLKGVHRVYDAHELFTEMQEVVTRPKEKKMWDWIERFAVPKFKAGYTIGECYAQYFEEKYGARYAIVRNATILQPLTPKPHAEKYILYQGAVNVGRCFEYLIPAMANVDMPLVICGEGNFFSEAVALTQQLQLQHKINFKGYVPPDQLRQYTQNAWIGITLFEAIGPSNRLSMANRFFDYMHSGVPQLAMAYPEYEKVNAQFELATLIEAPTIDNIAQALNRLISDNDYHNKLAQNALLARNVYCWQEEEKRLIATYKTLFAV